MLCLNVGIGLVLSLQLPGTAYTSSASTTGDMTEYETRFNATDIANSWKPPLGIVSIPLIGDIFSGFYFMWNMIRFLIDGFPSLLLYIKDSYIVDASGKLAFDVLSNGLRIMFGFSFAWFLIEFISGRNPSD